MARRKRTSKRSLCSITDLENARRRINDGESIRSVACSLGMHEATLRKRLKKALPATSLGRYDTTFSPEMEQELCEYIKKIDGMFYGLTTKGLRELAYQFAEQNNIQNRFSVEKKMAGKEWLRGFRSRHPDLSLRQPTSTSIARAVGFNKPQCDRFFKNLSELMDAYKFPPHAIYNMDETGISTVPNKPPKVVSTKGKRCVNKISSAERGVNVTAVCAMSASGHFIPPAFIYARKRMRPELLDGAPPSSVGMVSDSSFINSDIFPDWVSHFKDHARPSPENPILLILDNHTSHCSLKAVNSFRQNSIHALTLPPHSSHRTQPIDRCFFNSLKKFYAAECEKWLKNHPARAVTPYQIASIFAPAYFKAATPDNAVEGFRVTGIYPFNPDVFKEEDFLCNEVTERPVSDISPTEPIPNDEETHDEPSVPGEVVPMTATMSPEVSTKSIQMPFKAVGIQATSVEIPSSSRSVYDIAPLPKAKTNQRSTRKKKKSDIISSSSYKQELEHDSEVKNKTKIKNFKKPKNIPKKKIWKCPQCEQIYKEPIVEDWIECWKCKAWWHEKCTGYSNVGNFICDFCVD